MLTPQAIAAHTEELPTSDLLLVRLDQEFYALPSAAVREVARCRAHTPIPGAPPALIGIINQRGTILPVVDPRVLLDHPLSPPSRASRLVAVSHDEVDLLLLVDGVVDLVTVPTTSIQPLPQSSDTIRARMQRAVTRHADQLVVLLDLAGLVAGLREWS